MKYLRVLIFLLIAAPSLHATTWYIRVDGGTATQCTGTTNAAYPGTGTGVACAFSHPYWMMNSSGGWAHFTGGDTIQFADPATVQHTYFMGEQNSGVGFDWAGAGINVSECAHANSGSAAAGCILPAPPAGTSSAHTRILGQNAGNCHSSDHTHLNFPTVLSGISGAFAVLDTRGTNFLDISCIEVTQPDSCTHIAITPGQCNTATSNYIQYGLIINYFPGPTIPGAANLTLTDFAAVGASNTNILGAKMSGTTTWTDVYAIGGGIGGYGADSGGCNTSCETTGTWNVSHNIYAWNGCNPVMPFDNTKSFRLNAYQNCTDQSTSVGGGNGDGFVVIAAGSMTLNVDHSFFEHNTQDGFDSLHLSDDNTTSPSIFINTSWAEGNEGQGFKLGAGAVASAINNVLVGNCRVLNTASNFPLNPTNWNQNIIGSNVMCRANGDQWAFQLNNGTVLTLENNTTTGYGNVMYDLNCSAAPGETNCGTTGGAKVNFNNNLSRGYADPSGGKFASGFVLEAGTSTLVFSNGVKNNLWNDMDSAATGCPDKAITAPVPVNNQCGDPLLVGETNINAINPNLTSSSPAIGAGIFISGITTDYNGTTRANPPAIGAFEAPALATTYFVTPGFRTMHVGDLPPTCDVPTYLTSAPTVNIGSGSAIWSTPPTCTVTATSSSPVGTYPITVTAGTLVSGTVTYNSGVVTVIAANNHGAINKNAFTPNNGETSPPPGFASNLPWAVKEAVSNVICNMSTSNTPDQNTDCFQHLIASERGAQTATVKCSGTVVTASAGTLFTGILPADGPVNINGTYFIVASYTDATHLVLTTTPTATQCSTASVLIYLPRTMVAVVAGSAVINWVSGPQLPGLTIANEQLQLGFQTPVAKVLTINSPTQITLNTGTGLTIPNVTGTVPMYVATDTAGGGAGSQPLWIHIAGCGTYTLSHAVQSYGAYYSVFGDGVNCSILKLAPNSADFQTALTCFMCVNPVNSNDTFHVYWYNMGIEIGVGNPFAIGFTFAPSNYGRIDNMRIWSDDGLSADGLFLGKQYTGPGEVSNTSVYGFKLGISSSIPNHNMTLLQVTVEGQITAGISNISNHEQFRRILFDENAVPFMTQSGSTASAVLMNSEGFAHGAAVCVQNSTTALSTSVIYVRDLQVHGSCTDTVLDYASGAPIVTTGDITGEVWTTLPTAMGGASQTLFSSALPAGSLNLPIKEMPAVSDPASSGWCVGGADPNTWNASLAACTSTTWMLAPGQYNASGNINVTIPNTINHMQMYGAMPGPGAQYHVIFTVAGSSADPPLTVENCIQNQCAFVHSTSRTLQLLDDNTYNYACTPGAGELYIQDTILGGNLNTPVQTVNICSNTWMLQSNQEQPTQPKIVCTNASKIWIFGEKNEHNGPNLVLETGCQVELLGGEALGDPAVSGSGGDIMQNTDANISIAAFTMATQCTITGTPPCNNAFYFWADETFSGVHRTLPIQDSQTIGGTKSMNLLYDIGITSPPSNLTPFVGGAFIIGGRPLP